VRDDSVEPSAHWRQNTKNPAKGALFMIWHVYIVECRDGSLYTGITNNLAKRLAAHNDGTGAKYTAARRPVLLRYQENAQDRSTASQREATIKKLSREAKLYLCNNAARDYLST
jgi:putative endonuclease